MSSTPLSQDRVRGALLGTAIGDALGMPIEHLSHQNVRLYYKGIKAYRADEKRGELEAGQWTGDTQRMLVLAHVMAASDGDAMISSRLSEALRTLLPQARRWETGLFEAVQEDRAVEAPSNGAAVTMAPVAVRWELGRGGEEMDAYLSTIVGASHGHPASMAAAFGQAYAVRYALLAEPNAFDAETFWESVHDATRDAEQQLDDADTTVSARLAALKDSLDDFPLDLQDACGGTGPSASESWPFALAMFARNPHLPEATLLSAINVGGDANSVGAMCGALLGALNGADAFPQAWHDGLEARAEIIATADALYRRNANSDWRIAGA
ncbi:MAG: ADP-ribosylglycohydrolase family protein [Bacteroidota bacterium]